MTIRSRIGWAPLAMVIGLQACSGGSTPMDGGTDTQNTTDVPQGSDVPMGVDTPRPPTDVPMGVDTPMPPTDVPMGTDSGTPGTTPMIAGCRILPPDSPWNTDVSGYPMHARATQILAQMNPTRGLHPDWGVWEPDHYGIPWSTGTGAMPVPITWTASWGNTESDPLPCPSGGGRFCYPIPGTARIEGGPMAATDADRHVLYIDTAGAPNNCTLYELYNAQNFSGGGWTAQNGAIFPLGTNNLRPEGWTSADAAGLPILPGLVRVDEVLAGEIRHAIRFTMQRTAQFYIHPATHAAGRTGTDLPPMGLRVRLRADYPTTGLGPATLVIVRAMQRYGMILADNGSDWYFTGDSDDRWAPLMDRILTELGRVRGSDFQVLETGPFIPQ